jgi:hypothetical protein
MQSRQYCSSAYGIYQTFGILSTWFSNNGISIGGWKRQEELDGVVADLSEIWGVKVEHLGGFGYVGLDLNGTLARRQETAPVDVFGFTSPQDNPMHFSYLGLERPT